MPRFGGLGLAFGHMGSNAGRATGDPLTPTLDLQAASDTGSSSTDNITSDTTPDIDFITSVAVVENDVLKIFDNGVEIVSHTVTAGEAGSSTLALGLSALSQGTHSLTATHTVAGPITGGVSNPLVLIIDTTAPTLTSPTGTSTGTTTADISVSTNEATGTLYWVVDQNLSTPSAAQIKAGQDQGGSAADKSGSVAVSSTGVKTINITGLSSSTTYKAYFAHEDAAGNISSASASSSFTEDSGGVVLVATNGVWMPQHPGIALSPAVSAAGLIDATGEKIGFCGRIWTPDRGTKSIRNVSFRFGAVTKAGGSALTVSLQDTDIVNGPPAQPDGTQDQTVAVANGDAGFASNTYYTTGNLSADRSVTYGQLLSVVIEYDGAGRLGADSVVVSNLGNNSSSIRTSQPSTSLFSAAAWVDQGMLPNILFTFSDGTFGCFFYSYPFTTISTTTFNSGSAADERALEFQVPFAAKIDGGWALLQQAASANVDIVLYDAASSVLATATVDSNAVRVNNAQEQITFNFPEISLTANTTYRLSLKPTTVNSIINSEVQVASAAHFGTWPGGTAFQLATRVDAGAWTTTATSRPYMGLSFSAVSS